jgi:uncharacterized membrane protein
MTRRVAWLVAAAFVVIAGIVLALSLGGAELMRLSVVAPLVLLVPGLVLGWLLLPGRIGVPDRLLIAIMTSFALVIVAGVAVGATGIGLGPLTWALTFAALFVALAVAVLLRGRGPEERLQSADAALATSPDVHARSIPSGRQVGLFAFAAFLVVAAIGLSRFGAASQPYPGFTQLWAVPGDGGTVRIGVHNEEGQPAAYRLVLRNGTSSLGDWTTELDSGATWEQAVSVPGALQAGAELLLYRADTPDVVYRRVEVGPRASGSG